MAATISQREQSSYPLHLKKRKCPWSGKHCVLIQCCAGVDLLKADKHLLSVEIFVGAAWCTGM